MSPRIQRPKKMPEIDISGLPEAEGAKKQWSSFLDRNQSIVVQVRAVIAGHLNT